MRILAQTLLPLSALLLIIQLTACSGAEQGTGQAIDNLGSVIRHSSKKVSTKADSVAKKVWVPAERARPGTEISADEEEEDLTEN